MRLKPELLTVTLISLAALVALAACQPQAPALPTAEQTEAAIRTYLKDRGGLAMNKMEIEVGEIEADGDAVVAHVIFRTKIQAADVQGEMPFQYTLTHDGTAWTVSSTAAGASHEGLPPGHPEPSGEADTDKTEKKDPTAAH